MCGAWMASAPAQQRAEEAIAKTREFFTSLGLPATLHEVGIGEEHLELMAKKAVPPPLTAPSSP